MRRKAILLKRLADLRAQSTRANYVNQAVAREAIDTRQLKRDIKEVKEQLHNIQGR
jgi:hypothetical protein